VEKVYGTAVNEGVAVVLVDMLVVVVVVVVVVVWRQRHFAHSSRSQTTQPCSHRTAVAMYVLDRRLSTQRVPGW
jgi:hypothetical protein